MQTAKFLRYLMAFLMVAVNLWNFVVNDYAWPAVSADGGYLFVYFTGNEPEQEQIHFAVSTDGYNFAALNNNEPVVDHLLGKQSVRDPYILRGQDGYFYIVGTDMKATEGWTSNHALVTWKSKDLVNWTDETIIDIRDLGGEFANTNRAWAPQAIWDAKEQSYMLYWAHSTYENDIAAMYYAYTDDFKTLKTEPKLLYSREGIQTIDGDIIYNEKNGFYYMYFKHDETQKIAYVKSENLTGPYDTEEPVIVSMSYWGVEGSSMYQITGTNQWVMIMDEYGEGHFFVQQTADMENFRKYRRKLTNFDHLSPRHGSVVAITDEEYIRLTEAFGVSEIPKQES
ncbi:MAG: glycoside hydrolase family 43 protein [Clostridia bacterium]|nr:glycoside hydrolase family 43 protein [Clostridia bacterium]